MYLLCRLEGELISHDTWYIATYSRSLQGVLLIRGLGAHVDAPGGGATGPERQRSEDIGHSCTH